MFIDCDSLTCKKAEVTKGCKIAQHCANRSNYVHVRMTGLSQTFIRYIIRYLSKKIFNIHLFLKCLMILPFKMSKNNFNETCWHFSFFQWITVQKRLRETDSGYDGNFVNFLCFRFQCKKKVTLFPRLCIKEVVLQDCNSGGIENTIEKHARLFNWL